MFGSYTEVSMKYDVQIFRNLGFENIRNLKFELHREKILGRLRFCLARSI